MRRFILLGLFTVLSIFPAKADLPTGASIHQLDNGLQVLLIENRILPMTGVNVVIKTGSAYETFATSGMSHMLEHLLFNGTSTRSQKELYDAVDLIGGYNNANTSNFHTNFMMVTPADNIREGMEIQANMLFNSILPEDKFEKEKGIVLEEIAQGISKPANQIERNISHVLYPGHALSLPTLGTYATIKAMSRDDVYGYYKNAYVPNNMVMNVIGNFNSTEMLKLITEIYGSYQPHQVILPEMEGWKTGVVPLNTGDKNQDRFIHRFYDGDMLQVNMFYPVMMPMSQAFADLLDAFLSKKEDPLKESINKIYPDQLSRLQSAMIINPVANYLELTLMMKPDAPVKEIVEACQVEMQKLRFGVSPEIVSYHITKACTEFLQNLEKPHMFGIYNAETFAISGIEGVLDAYDAPEYQQAAVLINSFHLDRKPIVLLNHPLPISDSADTTFTLKDQKFIDPKTGLTLITRQNPASQLLAIHMLFKHKTKFESEYGKDAAKILHDCLGQRLSSQENQKISEKFGFSFTVNDNPYIPMDDIYLHPDFSYVRAEGLAEDYPAAIEYINSQLTNFTPTLTEYERAVGKFNGGMSRQKGEDIFKSTYREIIYKPQKYPAADEQPGYEQLVKFAGLFFRPENMIISIVSPGTSDDISELYSTFMSSSDGSPADTSVVIDETYLLLQNPIKKEIDGGGDQAFLFWGYTQEVPEPDKPALTALSLVLSDTIVFDIREKQGRAYRMRAGIDLAADRALFYLNMGTRPENIDPILAQVANFFSPMIVESLTTQKLTKVVNMYIGRMMFRRLSSINQAFYLGHSLYFHGNMYYDRDFHKKLQKVTLDQVKIVAARYLKPANTATVVVR